MIQLPLPTSFRDHGMQIWAQEYLQSGKKKMYNINYHIGGLGRVGPCVPVL